MILILGFFSSVLGETLISCFEQRFLCTISWLYFPATLFLQATCVGIFPPGLPPSSCATLLWSVMDSSFSAPESRKKHPQGRGDQAPGDPHRCMVLFYVSSAQHRQHPWASTRSAWDRASLSICNPYCFRGFNKISGRLVTWEKIGVGINRISGSISAVDLLT